MPLPPISYPVDYERDEHGWWVASAPQFPGCRTQGRTLAEARERIADAIALHVDDRQFAEWAQRERPRFPTRYPRNQSRRPTEE